MARVSARISTGILLVVIGAHAVVLPALYFGLEVVVSRSHRELFVQHVRTLSRNLAEELELGDAMSSDQRVVDTLDQAILNGDGDFAVLIDNDREIRSGLNSPGMKWPGRQDFGVRQGGGMEYFIALPISKPNHNAELRLGFDERPILEQIRIAMRRTMLVLVGYFGVAIGVAAAWSFRLVRPVERLQLAARQIARGDYVQSLRLRTGIVELHQLGDDLENMRSELVGVNKRLQVEVRDKERAEERHRELEGRLRHRQRLETVGTLAGGIAHEFNNVLLPIVLFAESAIAASSPSSSVREDLEEILGQAMRAKEVVDKILTFSREAGVPALEPVDLEAVLIEAIRLFNVLVPASVEVRVKLAGPYPRVRADVALTIQMVMNLCTNAYQALANGKGVVTISLDNSLQETATPAGAPAEAPMEGGPRRSAYLVLSVSDNGHGMDATTQERIFEPFFTTRGNNAGTGLGLSVVHGIAATFGATIAVQSSVGLGTTFRVFFPVFEGSATAISSSDTYSGERA